MSFSVSFSAPVAEVDKRLEAEHAPQSVKDFVRAAIQHFGTEVPVRVIATGHLYEPDSVKTSTASITVEPLNVD